MGKFSRDYQVEVEVLDEETGEVTTVTEIRNSRYEYPDPIPVAIPLALRRAETTDEKIKRLMNEQRAYEQYLAVEEESLLDADDFEVDDDLDPNFVSEYEFDPEQTPRAILTRSEFRRKLKREKEAAEADKTSSATPPAESSSDPADDLLSSDNG